MRKPPIKGKLKNRVDSISAMDKNAGRAFKEHLIRSKIIQRQFPQLTFEEAEQLEFDLSEETESGYITLREANRESKISPKK